MSGQAIRTKLVTRNANAAYMRKPRLSACTLALGSSEERTCAPAPHNPVFLRKSFLIGYEKMPCFPVFAGLQRFSPVEKTTGCIDVDVKERLQAAQRNKKYVNAHLFTSIISN